MLLGIFIVAAVLLSPFLGIIIVAADGLREPPSHSIGQF
jgi:hypothetical protein